MHVLPYQPQQLDPEEQAGAPPVDFLPVEAPPPPEEREARAKAFLKSNFLDRTQELRPPLVPHVISVRLLHALTCIKHVSDQIQLSESKDASEFGSICIVFRTQVLLQEAMQRHPDIFS